MSIQISKFGTSGIRSLVVDNSVLNESIARKKEDIKINEELKLQSLFDASVTDRLAYIDSKIAEGLSNSTYATLENLNTEITNRSNGDTELQNNINNLGDIYLKKISDSDLKMGALQILDCSTVQTETLESLGGEIQCTSTLNLQGFHNINRAAVVESDEINALNVITPQISSDSKTIDVKSNLSLNTYNLSANNITSNNISATTLNEQSILTPTIASTTYLTQANATTNYLSKADAKTTYLSQANASTTYLTPATASSTYLTQANASSTYLTQANASSTYLTSTLSTTLNANNNNISGVNTLTTTNLTSTNPDISVQKSLDLAGTNSIKRVLNVSNLSGDLKVSGRTNLFLECVDADISLLSNINALNKNISNAYNITTTLLNNKTPLYTLISADLDFKNYSITNINNLNATTLNSKTPSYTLISADLDFKNYSITNINILNATTLNSTTINNSGTLNVTGISTFGDQIKLNAENYFNQIVMKDTKNTTWGDAIGFITIGGNTGGSHMTLGHVGTTGDENGMFVYPPNQNIIFQASNPNNYVKLFGSNGEFLVNSGILRAGLITQDTSISCYAQYSQTIATSLAVPFNPAQQVVAFNTSLSPFNVTTSSPTFTSLTIQHSGIYRCVFSLNGEMNADREMAIYFRKNGTPIRTINASRLGTRDSEFSFNELINLVVNDVLTISVQALDVAFTFTMKSATFNIEKIRKNTL